MRGLRELPGVVWLLAVGVFVNAFVSFVFVFVFLYLTGPRGIEAGGAGLVMGAAGLGLMAGNFTGGWFGDRYGHRRTLLAAAAGGGLLLAVVPALPTPLLAGVLPLAQYALGVVRVANSALVAVTVPEGARRQAFAVIRSASNGGFAVGPPLGALIATRVSYDWLFLADGLGTLFFAAWTARVVPARGAAGRGRPDRTGAPLWRELRARPAVLVLLAGILLVDVTYRQLYTTFPLHLADQGLGTQVYGWLIAVNGAMIVCLELPAALALRNRPALPVVAGGLALVGTGYAALAAGSGLAVAASMMVLLTAGEILYKTTATAYVADESPEHAVGRFQSLYAGVSISGTVLAAPLGGALYEAVPGALWPACACAALGAAATVAAAHRLARRGGGVPSPVPAK
ncbi:MFS transporter [Streptomyces abyssomicinicus]|uniref:MFS transporter n=1 Tax=Streptomyces abyssomicinicus TaxID=574929 RepID=UPI0012503729|nr:MFS transporter [Streptomyces abyssomicinicus]